jgi:hypothetical protein
MRSFHQSHLGLFFGLLLFASTACSWAAGVWQWSVPAPTIENRRAYLWVPPDCKHVRGLVIACHNMLEEPLFERPAFRQACADNGLGIVMIFSGHDSAPGDDQKNKTPDRSYLDIFLNPYFGGGGTSTSDENPQKAGVDLQKVLDALADESGYTEIKYAPLLPVGHSSAGSFVWHLYKWDPSRIFAMMPFKTGSKDDGPEGIPIFDFNSEWFEYGNWDMHNVSLTAPDGGAKIGGPRTHSPNSLYGYFVDIGSGHCDVGDNPMDVIGLFLKKAVAERIPDDAPLDGPVQLKPVTVESGALLDPDKFGKPDGKAYAYGDYPGDPKKAFWYLDQELATAVQDRVSSQLAKKPQQIGFMQDGQPSTDARMFSMSPKYLDDGATFQMQAGYVDHIDHANFSGKDTPYYPPDTKLDHSDQPILYRVNSGGVVQVGPDTFRICPRDGPVIPQGNPWEPTIVAYSLGDAQYRPAEHPAHINVSIINKGGATQTLDFPKIPDQQSMNLAPITVSATASSGLPVQFFVASGPATIDGKTLTFDQIPIRAKFPIRIRVSAFQWGRPNGDQIQSVGPVTQEFFIQK